MATTRKSGTRAGRRTRPEGDAQEQVERLSRSLSESAQQIWLAGVGAFGRAQAEGTKLFDGLVREGQTLERTARRYADGRADVVREALEVRVGQARERATGTWERLENAVEERVQATMARLGVPARDDLRDLSRRVDDLTAQLRRQAAAAPAARPRAAKTGSANPAASKATARKVASKKAAAKKSVSRKSAPKNAVSKRATPKKATARKAAPRRATPKARAPARSAPRRPS